jgi:hypothetical protein
VAASPVARIAGLIFQFRAPGAAEQDCGKEKHNTTANDPSLLF